MRTKRRGVPNLGERIASFMEAASLDASELAARTGISVSYLTRIIRGEVVNPTIDFVSRIASGLGVTETELVREDVQDIKLAELEDREVDKEAEGTSSSQQEAGAEGSQKGASPSTVFHSPLPISHQKILLHRLTVAEKKLQTAGKLLNDLYEEICEIAALVAETQSEEEDHDPEDSASGV